MSAWVLVIVFNSSVGLAIDMPDRQSCYLALNKAMQQGGVANAFCLTRVAGLDKP